MITVRKSARQQAERSKSVAGGGLFFEAKMTDTFRADRARGLSYRAIACKHGCSVYTAYYVAHPERYAPIKRRKRKPS